MVRGYSPCVYSLPLSMMMVPFIKTLRILYGPVRGVDILRNFPGLSSSTLSPILYSWGIRFLFSARLDLFMASCFCWVINAQSVLSLIGRIMSQPNTNCPGKALYVVWSTLLMA